MGIPDYQSLMRPVLVALSDGVMRSTRETKEAVIASLDLTEEEKAEVLPSGNQLTVDNRVGWAISYLVAAGAVERPSRARLRISQAGKELLVDHPDRVDNQVLMKFEAFREFRARHHRLRGRGQQEPTPEQGGAVVVEQAASEISPQELIEQARLENRAAVEGELLVRAIALTPRGFERLVIRLLKAMGYGRTGMIEHSGKPGDGGIDGIISQDPLGLDRIYVQAKKYALGESVGRPTIQGFVGALMGAQGDRGVFITTSSFTSGAVLEAERVNARIELIDGARLAELMVDYGVAVQPEATVTLFKLDEDFFEEL